MLQPSIRIARHTNMNWIILVLAGLCECGFTFCLGSAKEAAGTQRFLWYVAFVPLYILSIYLLIKATQSLPIGTAYAVWTGIGAAGTVLIGIFFFHEPVTAARILFISTLILSIIGLKIVSI